jgi:hypothetical protein
VIHTAFIHDFSKFKENCAIDRRPIEALSDTLAGSGRPLVVTSGTGMGSAGPRCTCSMPRPSTGWRLRRDLPGRGITRSPRRVCRFERSPKRSAGA